MDAALPLFAQRGFHGTAVPQIAMRAGIAAGTLYRHFEGKEALVNALFQREKQAYVAFLMADFPMAAPPREGFRALWRRLGQFIEERRHSAMFLELHHHAGYLDHASLVLQQQALAPLAHFVERAQERQALKPLSPELLLGLVTGAFFGLAKSALLQQEPLDPRALADAEACLWEAVRL